MRRATLFAVTLAFAGAVSAQDLGAPAITNAAPVPSADQDAPTFETADRDSDGKVDRREAAASKTLVRQFAELDKDRDGALDKGEFARLETQQMRRPDGPEEKLEAPR